MSTQTLIRSSSAAVHHAMVLPIDSPTVAIRLGVHLGPGEPGSPRPRSESYTIMPHSTWPFHSISLKASSSIRVARSPKIQVSMHRARHAEPGQKLGVGRRGELLAAVKQFPLAERVVAAVRMVVQNRWRFPALAPWV